MQKNEEINLLNPKLLMKLDYLFIKHKIKNEILFKQDLLNCINTIIIEVKKEWNKYHNDTINSIIQCYKQTNATNMAKCRDKKYSKFREYFENIQKEEYLKNKEKFNIKMFVNWFMIHKSNDFIIPYVKQNQENKLKQLARINYKKFKTAEKEFNNTVKS